MIVGQHGPVVTIQPNLNAGWVLIRFANPEDAMKAQKSLMNNHFGQVESVSESEARALQQEIQVNKGNRVIISETFILHCLLWLY